MQRHLLQLTKPRARHTRRPRPELAEADRAPGCAQTHTFLSAVALDLPVCPRAPDTRLKLNYRLAAAGPKRGLFGCSFSEKHLFSRLGTGGKKNVLGFKEESAGREGISVFW